MTDTTIIEPVIVPPAIEASHTPLSWSAVIAGTLAAMAVTFIIVALGSGIGLSFASPYGSGPSATSLTVAAAVWLVMAQTMGFATGGYLAGRLRSPAHDGVVGETTFRDAAQGFVVWAIGTVVLAAIVIATGYLAASATARAASGVATSAAAGRSDVATAATTEYFVDLLFRPGPGSTPATAGDQRPTPPATVGAAPSGIQPTLNNDTRAEVTRILMRGISQPGLDDNDRAYLAQVVSARTGLAPTKPSAASRWWKARRAKPSRRRPTRPPRPVPISRSGRSCRCCSVAPRRRLPEFSAASSATTKVAWRKLINDCPQHWNAVRGLPCSILSSRC